MINKKILLKVKTHYTTLLGRRQNPTKRAEKVTFITAKDLTQRVAKDPTQRAAKEPPTKVRYLAYGYMGFFMSLLRVSIGICT